MLFTRNPDEVPRFTPEQYEKARALGLYPIYILCDPEGSAIGDGSAVMFVAFVSTTPRVGEHIRLESGKMCDVTYVYYKVGTSHDPDGKADFISMVPTVCAIVPINQPPLPA